MPTTHSFSVGDAVRVVGWHPWADGEYEVLAVDGNRVQLSSNLFLDAVTEARYLTAPWLPEREWDRRVAYHPGDKVIVLDSSNQESLGFGTVVSTHDFEDWPFVELYGRTLWHHRRDLRPA